MFELDEYQIERVKDLVWDKDLTKREAIALVLYEDGVSARAMAEDAGVSENLMYSRLRCAKQKAESR